VKKFDKHRKKILPNILVTNIRSIGQKLEELFCVIRNNNNVHIACITETWLNDNTPSDSLYMDGYSFYRCDRKDGRRGGGIVCYVTVVRILISSFCQNLKVKLLSLCGCFFAGNVCYV